MEIEQIVQIGDIGSIKLFIVSGYPVHLIFSIACQESKVEVAKFILKQWKCDVNKCLNEACIHGSLELTKLALEYKATNLNAGLVSTCYNDHMIIAKLLIENGANQLTALSYEQKRQLLNLGLSVSLVAHDKTIQEIIQKRKEHIADITLIADTVLYDIYKDKQMYDKNVLSIVSEYTNY